ncbi:VOC family protein [Grimontia hollisae]|uniref:VOC family protein n=1 Tax=Grimontia hollisae TaxID=673 RepID=UPI0012AC63E1|nr:VOC family protein [Grimontia hollisae]
MNSYVEHANITVTNLDNAIQFLQTAMPEFVVRGKGYSDDHGWCHLGTNTSYIALQEVVINKAVERIPYRQLGVNHIGFVVADAEKAANRLREAGYKEVSFDKTHPARKRAYFLDSDGNEWEFIEYLTDTIASRNDYLL